MQTSLIVKVLDVLLCVTFLFVSLRAFYLYIQIRNSRLFVLGLSMGVIALTIAVDVIRNTVSVIHLNTDYFLYCGQAISFLFIFLSILFESENLLYWLMRWHIIISFLLLESLILSPFVPDSLNPVIRILLSGSCSIICFVIFFYYFGIFLRKGTRFGLLMVISFMLLSFGYLMTLPMSIFPDQDILDYMGDIVRVFGVVTMMVGFAVG